MNNKQKAILAIFFGSLFSSAVAPLTKFGIQKIPPISFAFFRFFLASLVITPFFFQLKLNYKKLFIELVPLSLLATLNIILFVLGIRITTATIGQLLYAGVPLLVAITGYFLWRDKLLFKQILGISLGIIGVSCVVLLPVMEKGNKFSGDLQGNLLILLAVVLWSIYMTLSKKAQTNFTPFILTSIFIFVTLMVLFPLFLIELFSTQSWWLYVDAAGWLSVIYVAIFCTIFGYLLNQYAIKHGGSVIASMVFYLQPIFAFLTASVLLGERLTLGLVFGGITALAGIFLVTYK